MACPISFGDCVLALQIIHQIYEQCFKPVNNAQALYLNFQQDIARLGNCLREFKDAFEKALAHVDDIDSYLVDFEPLQVTLKAEADELVGDFKATLEECRDLLKNYVKFERKSGTFLDNLFWHASTQAMVEDLRRRIQSHTYKISLFVEPVKLRLTSDILANTHDILELLRRHFDLVEKIELPEIPAALKKEFRDALNNAPCWITDATQIPLTNGMDALILHYRQSTIQFTGFESNQTVEQYLNLLKAHWLVEILLESKALERTRPGHLYRRIIKQVEQRIAKQYGRREVPRYSEEALCALEKSTFAIWPQKIIVPPRPLTEPVGREEKLAEIPLVRQYSNERRDLFVFRVDDYKLRVVLRRTPDDQSQGSRETTERFFDLRNDGFVPLYTITESPRTEWNVDITYDNSAVPLAYALQSRDDVFKLQRAFTGYVAAAHSERVACAVTYKQATTKNPLGWIRSAVTQHGQQQGRGEIQLWQWPISQTTPLTKKDSIRSGSSHTKAAKVFQASNPSIISRSEVEDGMEVIVAALPPPPLLMAFTESGGTYTIWKTDLSELEMMKSGDLQTVLKHKARKLFPVHQLTVNKSELKSWNICALFASTEPSSRGPAPKTLDCTYMAIDFEKTEKPDRFDQSLLNVLTQRLRHQEDFRNGREVARKESQKPSRWLSVESNKESFTGLTAVSSASSVPVLPQIAKTVSLSLVDIDEDTEPTSPASSGRADSKLFELKEFGGK